MRLINPLSSDPFCEKISNFQISAVFVKSKHFWILKSYTASKGNDYWHLKGLFDKLNVRNVTGKDVTMIVLIKLYIYKPSLESLVIT